MRVVEMDGDNVKIIFMYLMSLNYTLKDGSCGKFYVCAFYKNRKFGKQPYGGVFLLFSCGWSMCSWISTEF